MALLLVARVYPFSTISLVTSIKEGVLYAPGDLCRTPLYEL